MSFKTNATDRKIPLPGIENHQRTKKAGGFFGEEFEKTKAAFAAASIYFDSIDELPKSLVNRVLCRQ